MNFTKRTGQIIIIQNITIIFVETSKFHIISTACCLQLQLFYVNGDI